VVFGQDFPFGAHVFRIDKITRLTRLQGVVVLDRISPSGRIFSGLAGLGGF
jgi:hypothetical protein